MNARACRRLGTILISPIPIYIYKMIVTSASGISTILEDPSYIELKCAPIPPPMVQDPPIRSLAGSYHVTAYDSILEPGTTQPSDEQLKDEKAKRVAAICKEIQLEYNELLLYDARPKVWGNVVNSRPLIQERLNRKVALLESTHKVKVKITFTPASTPQPLKRPVDTPEIAEIRAMVYWFDHHTKECVTWLKKAEAYKDRAIAHPGHATYVGSFKQGEEMALDHLLRAEELAHTIPPMVYDTGSAFYATYTDISAQCTQAWEVFMTLEARFKLVEEASKTIH